MKPFNLERAIAGDPMVFKSGQKIHDIAWHPATRRFVGQIHKKSYFYSWDENGEIQQTVKEKTDHYHLMMAPIIVSKWILLNPTQARYTGPFSTKEAAEWNQLNNSDPSQLTLAKIEYKE